MNLNEIHRRLEAAGKLAKPAPTPLRPATSTPPSDIAGEIERLISSEIARQLAGREAPADHKPVSRHIEDIRRRVEKAHEGRPAPEPSTLLPKAPQGALHPVGELEAVALDHDARGRLWHARIDSPVGAFVATVLQRDANGKIERAQYTPVEA